MRVNGEEKSCCEKTNTIIRHEPGGGKTCGFIGVPMGPEWAHIHARDCPEIAEIECECGENDKDLFFANGSDDTRCIEGDTYSVSEGESETSLDNIRPLAEDGYPFPRMKKSNPSCVKISGPEINQFYKGIKAVKRAEAFTNRIRNDGRVIEIVFPALTEESLKQIKEFCHSKFLVGINLLLLDRLIELRIVVIQSDQGGIGINSQIDAIDYHKSLKLELRNLSTNQSG